MKVPLENQSTNVTEFRVKYHPKPRVGFEPVVAVVGQTGVVGVQTPGIQRGAINNERACARQRPDGSPVIGRDVDDLVGHGPVVVDGVDAFETPVGRQFGGAALDAGVKGDDRIFGAKFFHEQT